MLCNFPKIDVPECPKQVLAAGVASVGAYYIWRYFQGGRFTKNVRIDGKVVIVTGANTGIGLTTALDLAQRGGRVYLACRDVGKSEAARQEIVRKTGNVNVFTLKMDLGSLKSVRECAAEFLNKESRLDILINNAGLFMSKRAFTADGFQMEFGVNHLGPFLFTNLLLDTLKSSAPSRIVNLSSIGHYSGALERDNLQGEKNYTIMSAYSNSKLANVLFTRELAKRLAGTGVTANSLHPGAVRTELARDHLLLRIILYLPQYIFMKSVWSGAQTTLTVALDPELESVTGKYFTDCVIKKESENAQSDESAEWLWKKSEELIREAENKSK